MLSTDGLSWWAPACSSLRAAELRISRCRLRPLVVCVRTQEWRVCARVCVRACVCVCLLWWRRWGAKTQYTSLVPPVCALTGMARSAGRRSPSRRSAAWRYGCTLARAQARKRTSAALPNEQACGAHERARDENVSTQMWSDIGISHAFEIITKVKDDKVYKFSARPQPKPILANCEFYNSALLLRAHHGSITCCRGATQPSVVRVGERQRSELLTCAGG